ncbi:MAG: hypothetical protein CM15mP81_15720 [Alphaproteobacteria bacterium]|nr:MAG: hypothetical protein CM15mP81_15720 [Alphaproteobacteria bacterium]
MSFDLVWAEITMAAIVGSTLYGFGFVRKV